MSAKAPWVKLDLDFNVDDRIADLIVEHGATAVGVYFVTNCLLSKATAKRLLSDRLATVAHACNVPLEKYREIWDSLVRLKMYEVDDDGYFHCPQLNKRLAEYDAMVERNRKNGRKGGKRKATANPVAKRPLTQSLSNRQPTANPVAKQNRIEENRVEQNLSNKPSANTNTSSLSKRSVTQHDLDLHFLKAGDRNSFGPAIREAMVEYADWPDKLVQRTMRGRASGVETWVIDRIKQHGWPKTCAALVMTEHQAEKPTLKYADAALSGWLSRQVEQAERDDAFTTPALDWLTQ